MNRRVAPVLCSLVALATFATACGDDPAPAVGDGAAPEAASESTLPPAGGSGAGTVVVGDRSWPFEADVCTLEPANHGGRDFDYYVHGLTEDGVEVEVYRSVSDEGNRIETVRVAPDASTLVAATVVVPAGELADRLTVTPTLLSGEVEFDSTGGVAEGPGRVDVTCS